MTFFLYALAPVTLICLGARILVRTALKHHPSARYATCLLALTFALLAPLFVGLRQVTGLGWITVFLPQASAPTPRVPAPDAPQDADWPMIFLLAVWAAGVGWGAFRFFQGAMLAARLRRSARSLHERRPRRNESRRRARAGVPAATRPRVARRPLACRGRFDRAHCYSAERNAGNALASRPAARPAP